MNGCWMGSGSLAGRPITAPWLKFWRRATGRHWLEKLGDAYGQRERVVMEAAFREGFCRAALLALDVLAYQAGLPED